MPEKKTYVIVGANQCGGSAAETLRKEGFDGRVVLIGAEPEQCLELGHPLAAAVWTTKAV